MSTTDDCGKARKKVTLPKPTQKELEEKAKAEEFWSDPCWTEPYPESG